MLERGKVLLLQTLIGIFKKEIKIMIKEAGWKIKDSKVIDNLHLVTVEMTSTTPCEYTEEYHIEMHNDLAPHAHHYMVSTDLFTFEEEPTTEDIEAAVIASGFTPTLPDRQRTTAIKTITVGEVDVFEYSARSQPVEFLELFNMIPIIINENPTAMSLKGDWLHLSYVGVSDTPPAQFFTESFFLYSVRIHKDTGEIRRKGYNKGMTLGDDVTSTLEGFNLISNILAVGIFLDEPRVTVYYMKSSDEKDYVANVANVDIPYYGTTWENGIKIRTREYTR